MNAPPFWGVLGLVPTNDEAAIRSAYAERLKRTNPEDDPEGFKRLRTAYEIALRQARWVRMPQQDERDFHDDNAEEIDEEDTLDAEIGDANILPPMAREPAPVINAPLIAPRQLEPHEIEQEAHRKLCAQLESLLVTQGDPAAIKHAYDAMIASPAMQQVAVFARTESWLIYLIPEMRPASDVLVEPAIAQFKWELAGRRVRDGQGAASMLALRKVIAEEQHTGAFLERVRDKRHEFHPAYLETTRPIEGRTWLARVWALRRFGRVRRFVEYIVDKAPHAEQALDAGALAWWRSQLAKSISPLWVWDFLVKSLVGVAIVAAIFASMPKDNGATPSENASTSGRAEARVSCQGDVTRAMPSAADNLNCQSAFALMPDSLSIVQNEALVDLKTSDFQSAEQAFAHVLDVSPVDPYAMFGRGLAMTGFGTDEHRQEGRALMQQALHLDNDVAAYYAGIGLPGPLDLAPAVSAPIAFKPREIPRYDRPPRSLGAPGQSIFDEAYAHFGITDPSTEGRVLLECLVHANGSVGDCKIMEEAPRNHGLGEVAIYVINSVKKTPATLHGVAVDGVPIRIPVRFTVAVPDGGR